MTNIQMERLMEEMSNQRLDVSVSDTGRFGVRLESAREEVARRFSELIEGSEDISKCIANPSEFSMTLNARILMTILASAPKTEDEKKLFEDEQRFMDASEKANNKLNQAHSNIASYRSKYALLEADHFSLMSALAASSATRDARAIFEEVQVSRESLTKLAQAIDAEERAIPTYVGDVDAAENKLMELRGKAMTSLYDPISLLLSSFGVDLDILPLSLRKYNSLTIKDRKMIKDALQPEVMGYLLTLTGIQGGSTTTERALFPKNSSVFAPSIDADFAEFKSTEVSRVIQQVYNLGLEMEQLRNQSGSDFQRATRVYDLSNDSVIVTSNPLQREVHKLNLISLAGYDPERWAQAFGIPISGIAKQILSAWGNGSKGPLKPEDIRAIFRGDRDKLPYDLDYTSLSYTTKVEELRSINKDVKPTSVDEISKKLNSLLAELKSADKNVKSTYSNGGVPDITLGNDDETEREDEQPEA
jgi:hypothetical protein